MTITTILGIILGSDALFAFLTYLFQRNDGKIKLLEDIKKQQIKEETDNVRTQLLLMISNFPDETSEILEIARHYFVDLKGNWFATRVFNRWLEKYKVGKPEWFKQ